MRPLPNVTKSNAVYQRARELIPGGTMLLSKRPEIQAPQAWPAYYRRAWGCQVEDIDGNVYTDFTGDVGSTLLGRADPDVNAAVHAAVDAGNCCSQNSPGEVELAELLTKIIPCAQQVRFCRGGGEGDAVAIRIARGYTKRDRVAFCGYHGWQDWYLAANLGDSSRLDGHLLPGLRPLGVPRPLAASAIPFQYNNLDSLRTVLEAHPGEFAAVILEATRHHPPASGFLAGVKDLARRHGAVLIFDEVVTGFRMAIGGAQEYFGVTPDLAVFAKTISNGYPMAAVVGRAEVMSTAVDQFISSTYWTDSIGTAASLAAIEKIRRVKAVEHVWKIGEVLRSRLAAAVKATGAPAEIHGWPPLVIMTFPHKDEEAARAMKTFYVRAMLRRGYLASGGHYLTYAHGLKEVEAYASEAGEALAELKSSLDGGRLMDDIDRLPCQPLFRRLV